jgi:magnesium-transporting ATPase (P-type)
MSVLVRDTNKDKIYVFIKGAPERIDRNSIFKFKDFENIVASFSLGGYRTIGYGYKEVPSHKLNLYLEGERDTFEKDITALGLVAFENKLKADTRETIDKLNMSDI